MRLRSARESAGFETATAAAKRHGWSPPTYLGHENGTRGITVEAAKKYARAFRKNADWLPFGTDQPPNSGAEKSFDDCSPGFSEDAIPFEGDAPQRSALKGLFSSARTPEIAFTAIRDVPGLSICAGDLIVCDLATTGRSGQLVIVQHVDPDTSETFGHTLRQYIPPLLATPGNGLTAATTRDDDPGIIIRFPVVGIIRQP